MEKLFEQECLLRRIDLVDWGMRAASEKVGDKVTRPLIAGCRIIIKNISVGMGFAHFDRWDAR